MKLGKAADIFSGVSFRKKVKPEADGDLAVIQMKDLENDYTQVANDLTHIKKGKIKDRYLLQDGDVLFVSKGAHNKAILYPKNDTPVVASSTFFILRPKNHILDPGFLTWFINSPKAQNLLRVKSSGTYIPNINKKVMDEIEIPRIPMEKQSKIAAVYKLQLREQSAMTKLRIKRAQYLELLLMNSIKEKK